MTEDVAVVLDQLQIQIASIGANEIAAHCPFHADAHPSFSINVESGLWICYQCTESGNLEMLVEKVGGTSDAKTYLKKVRFKKVTQRKSPKKVPPPEPPEVSPSEILARYESFGLPPHWAREERKLSDTAVEDYGIKWHRGWVIPIWAPPYELVAAPGGLLGWQFKRLDYVRNYPRAVKKSQTLFGLWEAEDYEPKLALVESPLDVVRLASMGVPSVASFGAMVSKKQVQLLIEFADRVVLALDADEEGVRQTEKLYRYLNKFVPTTKAVFPAGVKDPGEMSGKQVIGTFHDIQRHAPTLPRRRHRYDARQGIAPSRPRNGFGQDSNDHRYH